ncbi:MAG: TetR family transcriptional regulator [Erythrobacter sp.]|nr:TetR family transcriptional regulator [Erythrobacter sp.]|tara:strand:+ start:1143 stop:1805 length:663 start_codon:yes stop_codon:yes gene_type:complete
MGTREKRVTERGKKPAVSKIEASRITRDVLIEAAQAIMSERGGVDFTLSEVGNRAGMSAALVQYHFGSKEGLLFASFEQGIGRSLDQLRWLSELKLPAAKKLRMHIGGVVSAYMQKPFTNRLLHLLIDGATNEKAQRVADVYILPIVNFHRDLISQGVEEGVFRPISEMHFYFLLVGACEHFASRKHVLRYVFNVDDVEDAMRQDYADFVYGVVMNGIAA